MRISCSSNSVRTGGAAGKGWMTRQRPKTSWTGFADRAAEAVRRLGHLPASASPFLERCHRSAVDAASSRSTAAANGAAAAEVSRSFPTHLARPATIQFSRLTKRNRRDRRRCFELYAGIFFLEKRRNLRWKPGTRPTQRAFAQLYVCLVREN